jgi:putative heme iron utilization protein
MARGWESKSVESQIESAEARDLLRKQPQLTAEQMARKAKRESLELDRKRVLRDLEAARHPRHKEMLKQALAHLDKLLAELGSDSVS